MSSLDLKIEVPTDILTHETFDILCEYLQPDTALTLASTTQSILDLLPEKAPHSTEVWSFGDTCIEVAEQIPYHHPSQLKLVGLLKYPGKSTKLGQISTSKVMNTSQYFRYQRLGDALRDALYEPDPDRPGHYVNFHAFAANIYECRIFRTDPTWAIWAQREAHEKRLEGLSSVRDEYVSYSQERFPSMKWHFGRDQYKAVASGEKEDEKGFGQECKIMAAKTADLMDSLENNMTFGQSD
ncbi:MAG: hypothetical protein ASARMPRED_006969 [Alectoria sarmentosa]|nr:MAG: hypothetical protein ASARMPRED_006969 [Alectoria sarmentosa]